MHDHFHTSASRILQEKFSLSIESSATAPPVSTAKHKYLLPPSLLSNRIVTRFTSYSLTPCQNLIGLTCRPSNSIQTFTVSIYRNKPECQQQGSQRNFSYSNRRAL